MDHYPAGDAGKWGGLRAARIEAYLEQWSPLAAMADVLLARADLTDVERLEAYGDKSLAIVESGDPDAAERFVIKGRDIIDALRLGEGGKLPLEVAQIHFALGEIRKLRSEAIVFVPVPANFAVVLERRCQGLLDAQSAYSDAMRSYDAHWAAMSGYRIGQLYQRLHEDVIHVPAPQSANTPEKKQLFEGAMRLRYRILLQKGLTMMEHTPHARRTHGRSEPLDRPSPRREARSRKGPHRAEISARQAPLLGEGATKGPGRSGQKGPVNVPVPVARARLLAAARVRARARGQCTGPRKREVGRHGTNTA